MEPRTLAQHLHRAARRQPGVPALLSAGGNWDYAGLCDETARLAESLAGARAPLQLVADAATLALAAYACSLAGRAFWPCRPGAPLPDLAARPPAGTALIIATSGSEGRAKAVPLSAAHLDAAAGAANARLPLAPGDLWLACLPLYHIGGQAILWRCARAGATVLLHDGFDAAAVRRDLDRHGVTHVSLVPAMLAHLLDLDPRPPTGLRCALVGGAALSRPLFERAAAAGWPIFPTYGMSETAAQIATYDGPAGNWQEGLVGRPLPGVDLAIGEDGRIRVRGPQVMAGYLEGGGLDAGGWHRSGDLGRIDADGRLYVLGRGDDILVSGGHNVHPGEIESCLAACPGVADVAVAGRPDPVWGDLIVAVIAGNAEETAILAWGRKRLPPPARPRRILRLDRLPRNATGKIDRLALRQIVLDADACSASC